MTQASAPSRWPVVLVIIALGLSIGVGTGVVWLRWRGPARAADRVGVSALSPGRVVEGEAFDLTVQVRNRTGEAMMLEGVDLSQTYTQGFVLLRTVPTALEEVSGPLFDSFRFEIELPPGGETRVVFRLQGVSAGEYAGDVDVRLTGPVGQRTTQVATTIAPPVLTDPGAPDAEGDPLIIQPPRE